MTRTLNLLVAVAGASLVTQAAVAFPDFCEDGDAGSLPGGAQKVTGPVGQPVNNIHGKLSNTPQPVIDLEDMYQIFIADPTMFEAFVTTDDPTTTFAPQLWLFAGPGLAFDDEKGLLGNNGVGLGFDGAMLGNMSTDGTMIQITEPGLYYLAISGQDPVSGLPGRFPTSGGPAEMPIFDFMDGVFEVSGPDGTGGDSEIDGWVGEGQVGDYSINLMGVEFLLPGPGALGLLTFGLLCGRRRRAR